MGNRGGEERVRGDSEWRTISGIQRELRTGRPEKPGRKDDGNHDEDKRDSPRFSRPWDRSTPTPGST